MVVLTARDEKRDLAAVEKLNKDSTTLSDHVIFHQLNVVDPTSIASIAGFIRTQFGKLEIWVNNAGIGGNIPDIDAVQRAASDGRCIPSERVKGMLHDIETLTDAKVDELLNEFLQDFQDGLLESKGWLDHVSAYTLSKSAMNAFTRMLAKKYPNTQYWWGQISF